MFAAKWFFIILGMLSISVGGHEDGSNSSHVWRDTKGRAINAHGGSILNFNGVYYWFGEVKQGPTRKVPTVGWENCRVDAKGISCYSSRDLNKWTYEGIVLAADPEHNNSELHTDRVMERPRVIYNKNTGQFVMWLHLDNENYTYARAAVAVSEFPAGPYRIVTSHRPNGHESRDLTLLQEDDGVAYLIYASEGNSTMYITKLSEDYLSCTSIENRILVNQSREAPVIFKTGNQYYLLTSGCTGWRSNALSYAVANHPLKEWKVCENPCTGVGAEITFETQGTFILPFPGKDQQFLFLTDEWRAKNLQRSRYVWLPMRLEKGKPELHWVNNWAMEMQAKN